MKSRTRRSTSEETTWTTNQLEQRLMLAADAGIALAAFDAVAEFAPANTQEPAAEQSRLVFIDSGVEERAVLAQGVSEGAEVVLLDGSRNAIDQITEVLANRRDVASVHIVSHGSAGTLGFAAGDISNDNLEGYATQLRLWRTSLSEDADILLYGCDAASGEDGRAFIERIASLTEADVAGSTDATGAALNGGDWDLERVAGQVETRIAFNDEATANYDRILALEVQARGDEGGEQFRLIVGGETVGTFTTTDSYQTFTHNVNGLSADDVRIEFFGDQYDPAAGIDANLQVDYIRIDGTTYQTEDPTTYSTGTWLAVDGVAPGFRQSEYLHTDGFFQFDDGQSGSAINVRVRGNEGTEQFNLIVNGTVAGTYNVTTGFQTISYTASGAVTADDVRIEFLNDVYDPNNGIDANLIVDYIQVDGTTYQTEASDVYSTGTWLAADGLQPGFRQSDTLHTNGYFQFAGATVADPGSISLTVSSINVSEGVGDLVITVLRQGGSDGVVTVNYETNNGTATAGEDFVGQYGTLTFADQEAGRQVIIPVVNDSSDEPNETFTFRISNPTGGATLGLTSQMIVLTDDDDFSGVVFSDNFESNTGWTTNPSNTDTATTGAWAIGNPAGTASGSTTLQLDSTTSGSQALVTDPAAGTSVGSFDIDNGVTSVASTTIALPQEGPIQISFNYNFAHLDNATSDDFLRVTVVGDSGSVVVLNEQGDGSTRAGQWLSATTDISALAGQSVQVLVESADGGGGSLVESAIDDLIIEVPVTGPGVIGVAAGAITVDESDGTATIAVQRTDGSTGAVSVAYTTVNGSAAAGSDYVSRSGTLSFAAGQATASITVPVTDDSADEDLEEFSVVLSNPSGGASLSSANETVVTIVDNDNTVPGFLPDLVSIGSTLNESRRIDTTTQPGRVLLRLSSEVGNSGSGPLELWGGAVSGNTQEVFQRIYGPNGTSNDVLAGQFVYHPSHGHIHFEGFATYNLREINPDGSMGAVVATGGKTSFCVINIRSPFPDAAASAEVVNGRGGSSCGSIQGLSVGRSDVYSSSLADQWVDVTDVADGNYFLEVIADPDNAIIEEDETNNSAAVQITLDNPVR